MRRLGLNVVIVSYDDAKDAARFAARHDIGFPILSDPKSRIIRAFGVLDAGQAQGSFAWGSSRPVTFYVDAQGIIRKRFSEAGYRERPDPGAVLQSVAAGL